MLKMQGKVMGLVCASLMIATSVAAQQADPRDTEASYFAPSNTLSANLYLRMISGMDNPRQGYSQILGLMRGTYLLKFGNLAISPVDFFLPFVDATVFSEGSTPLHLSGLADLRYLPTVTYHLTQDAATNTHSWFALTTYFTLPTGQYDPDEFANLGENRFAIQPVLTVGQRLWRRFTIEGFAGFAWYDVNSDSRAVVPLSAEQLGVVEGRRTQQVGFNGGVHTALDLSPTATLGVSYLFEDNRQQRIRGDLLGVVPTRVSAITQQDSWVNMVRFTLALALTPQTAVRLQWSEDLSTTGGRERSRYLGIRMTHAMFLSGVPGAGVTAQPAGR